MYNDKTITSHYIISFLRNYTLNTFIECSFSTKTRPTILQAIQHWYFSDNNKATLREEAFIRSCELFLGLSFVGNKHIEHIKLE